MQNQSIFFNNYGRLRSGWRFCIFLVLFILSIAFVQIAVSSLLRKLPIGYSKGSFLNLSVESFISLATAIGAGWFCQKYLEGLPFRTLGIWFTKNWFKDLFLGLLLGALAVSFAVSIAAAFGGLRFSVNNSVGSSAIFLTLGVSFVVFALAAAFEEVLFRGYMLQTFSRAGLAWFAIALTSVFFGFVHLGNPGANIISTANTILAGVLFSVAYLKTRTLWLVFGLHFIWNWMQGAFYGIEVSGLTDITTAPFLVEFDRGPVWLTGENYGIEGGIACTISLIVFTILIWKLPFLTATEEMSALTGLENPAESARSKRETALSEEN